MEPSQVLRADAVITCDGRPEVHRPGQVEIDRSGRVVYAGSVRPTDVAPTELGGLLMPGLVNVHGHGPMTLLRGVGDGLPLDRWLNEEIWPREANLQPGDVETGMLLASVEMLRAGVTTSCDMYFADDEMISAVRRTGGRLVCTPAVVGVVHGDALAPGGRLDEIRRLHADHHDLGSTVTVGIGPHSPYDLGTELLGALAQAARDLETVLHLHVAETADEGAELERAVGCSTVEHLHRTGVLDGHVLTAHSVWIGDADIERYAEHGTHVAHCPVSNMKLGSGIAPISAMRRAGVNVALGTDGVADGLKVASECGAMTRVVMLTVSQAERDLLDAVSAGACGYLLKSTPPDELRNQLWKAAQGEPVFSPSLAALVLTEFRRMSKAEAPGEALSAREREVLQHVARGHTYKEIGEELFIAEKTVENHVRNILAKLHLNRKNELMRYAIEHGIE